jgi:hypothetical protein
MCTVEVREGVMFSWKSKIGHTTAYVLCFPYLLRSSFTSYRSITKPLLKSETANEKLRRSPLVVEIGLKSIIIKITIDKSI